MKEETNIKEISKILTLKVFEAIDFSTTTHDKWDIDSSLLKLDEEFGELSEAILFQIGLLPHKKLKEKAIGEVADNFIQICCIFSYQKDIKKYLNQRFNIEKKLIEHCFLEIKPYETLFLALKDIQREYRLDCSEIELLNVFYLEYILKRLTTLAIITKAIDDKLDISEINEDYIAESIATFVAQIDLKLNKWKRNYL